MSDETPDETPTPAPITARALPFNIPPISREQVRDALGDEALADREIVGAETTGPMRGERVRGVVFDEFQPEAPAPRASAERSDSSPAAVVGARSHWRVITSSEYMHQRHLGNRTLVEEVGVPLTLEKRTTYWAQEPALYPLETDIARLHDRFLGDPRFHAAVKHIHFLTEVSIDTGRLTQNDLLRTTAMLERILATPAPGPEPMTRDRLGWWADRIYDAMEFSAYTVDTDGVKRGHDEVWDQPNALEATLRAFAAEIGLPYPEETL